MRYQGMSRKAERRQRFLVAPELAAGTASFQPPEILVRQFATALSRRFTQRSGEAKAATFAVMQDDWMGAGAAIIHERQRASFPVATPFF